jgi:hypothetical protein
LSDRLRKWKDLPWTERNLLVALFHKTKSYTVYITGQRWRGPRQRRDLLGKPKHLLVAVLL